MSNDNKWVRFGPKRGLNEKPATEIVDPAEMKPFDIIKLEQLFDLCRRFIEENEISCGELIYQCDALYEPRQVGKFVEQIAEIVGYCEFAEDE